MLVFIEVVMSSLSMGCGGVHYEDCFFVGTTASHGVFMGDGGRGKDN